MKQGLALFIALNIVSFGVLANPVEGKWYSFDDDTGSVDSEITLRMEGDKLEGRITKLLNQDDDSEAICTQCRGEKHNAPILSLKIISGFTCEQEECVDGTILDPRNGKLYSAKMTLEDSNTLQVRGYVGSPMFGKTKIWRRDY